MKSNVNYTETCDETTKLSNVKYSTHLSKENKFLHLLKIIILENISDPKFGIEDLCAILKICRTTLHLKIKAQTGLSTSHFINKVKMQKAKEIIDNKKHYISEVSYQVGITNLSYFSKVFKNEFGITAKAYKDSVWNVRGD